MKCDRCGRKIRIKTWEDDMQIHGVSKRCSERVWQVCPECLKEIIEFMDKYTGDYVNWRKQELLRWKK